jgi:hypothetical protein
MSEPDASFAKHGQDLPGAARENAGDGFGAGDGDKDNGAVRLTLPQVLGAVQAAPLPVPLQNPAALPLNQLDPEVLERLAAEVVSHRNNRGAHFYGRRGQKQHGLDIVEFEWAETTSLYQVKRYETLSPAQMKSIVEEYAGPPRQAAYTGPKRRFDPHRFVIVTSALVESDTGNIDGLKDLQDLYKGDLIIEVWGAEVLGRKLRGAPHAVLAIFGQAWAKAWCGFEPAPVPPGAPKALGLVEDPVSVLNLESLRADAAAREVSDPLGAAAVYGAIARSLKEASFPGHAAVMCQRQAEAAEAGGDQSWAFAILFQLGLDTVLIGERFGALRHKLDETSALLGGLQADKSAVLGALADWYEQGSHLAVTVPALKRLADAGDPYHSLLACLVIEQAVVDGLYDYSPPFSVVTPADPATEGLLRDLAELAAVADASDPVIRARLHCAVADALLRSADDAAAVSERYGTIVDDALAGRYLHARGLVTSRAAYAYAARGSVDRATTLWRQSILASSEEGFFGDVRNAMRASDMLSSDRDIWTFPGISIVASALPDNRRILSGSGDPALAALDAAHEGKLPDAFGDARRYIWESRISGHLLEEMLAMSLFGDVVAEGGSQAAAVICYVLAGEADKAAKLAATVPDLIGVSLWISSGVRRRRAAAIRVAGAQALLVNDEDVLAVVETLLRAAKDLWIPRSIGPQPELDAVKAVASFGVRIPGGAVDAILEVAAPALSKSTVVSSAIANLLIQAYWAVESRRADLANALMAMLRLPGPPQDLWQLLSTMPAIARPALLPTITSLAEDGDPEAISVLASWRQPSEKVQLAARRACAAFFRRPIGIPQGAFHVGTQELATVNLLLALLDARQLAEVPVAELTPERARPAGGILFTHITGAAPSPPAAPVINPAEAAARAVESTPDTPDQPPAVSPPDEAAIKAAGRPADLAAAVATHLVGIAGDTYAGAANRANALSALRYLLPSLQPASLAELVPPLLKISRDPALSDADQFEIDTDTELSRNRMRTGARELPAFALVAAAEAFAEGRDKTIPLGDAEHPLVDEIIALASGILRDASEKSQNPFLGALSIAALARSAPDLAVYATGLVFHGRDNVRALGARYAPGTPDLFRVMSTDPSPQVRIAIAGRAPELPEDVQDGLSSDTHLGVRWAIKNNSHRTA